MIEGRGDIGAVDLEGRGASGGNPVAEGGQRIRPAGAALAGERAAAARLHPNPAALAGRNSRRAVCSAVAPYHVAPVG